MAWCLVESSSRSVACRHRRFWKLSQVLCQHRHLFKLGLVITWDFQMACIVSFWQKACGWDNVKVGSSLYTMKTHVCVCSLWLYIYIYIAMKNFGATKLFSCSVWITKDKIHHFWNGWRSKVGIGGSWWVADFVDPQAQWNQ